MVYLYHWPVLWSYTQIPGIYRHHCDSLSKFWVYTFIKVTLIPQFVVYTFMRVTLYADSGYIPSSKWLYIQIILFSTYLHHSDLLPKFWVLIVLPSPPWPYTSVPNLWVYTFIKSVCIPKFWVYTFMKVTLYPNSEYILSPLQVFTQILDIYIHPSDCLPKSGIYIHHNDFIPPFLVYTFIKVTV